MQISSKFTIALHILSCVIFFDGKEKITSEFLAGSIHCNPVIVRKILSQLSHAGLIQVKRGTGGIEILHPLREISFYDIYEAVEVVDQDSLFRFHMDANEACPIGRNIHTLLDARLDDIQEAMEKRMRKHTLADLRHDLKAIR
jgi:DNA-binding IscR family transcriptional regulator